MYLKANFFVRIQQGILQKHRSNDFEKIVWCDDLDLLMQVFNRLIFFVVKELLCTIKKKLSRTTSHRLRCNGFYKKIKLVVHAL